MRQDAVHLLAIARVLSLRDFTPDPRRLQLKKLRAMVAHTWRHHEAYARWWRQHGCDPVPIRGWDDFSRLPVIGKMHFRELAAGEHLAANYRTRDLLQHLTSGSTGIPFRVERTVFEDRRLGAYRLRERFLAGLRPGDLRVSLKSGMMSYEGGRKSYEHPPWMKWGLFRRVGLNHIALGPEGVLRKLRELRPNALGGHADAMFRLCLESPPGALGDLRLKFVSAGVQTVTPDMYQRFCDAFGCPVYVTYGVSEFNLVSTQCAHTGLHHLNEEGLIVEVLKDGRPARDGEHGEVVATNLDVYSMPLIRYAIDDWATMGPDRCPCGRPVRTLREIQGRVAELFHFSGGRKIHPLQLINPLLAFVGWMREYRVVQTARDRVEIWFDTLPGAPEDAVAQVEDAVGAKAPAGVRVQALRRAIPPLPERGKNKMFQSLGPEEPVRA